MKPLVLCVLDGYGMREESHGNAIKLANTPNFDYLWNRYPHSLLEAGGTCVGLPSGAMGGSEVGHLNMGAGRIIYQPLELINQEIASGEIKQNKTLLDAIDHVKKNNSKFHCFGMSSDKGVHSDINHLFAILDILKEHNVTNVYLHLCTDGRDSDVTSGIDYVKRIEEKLSSLGIGKIATIGGRYYAMDRDRNWDRIKIGYDAIVNGIGEQFNTAKEALLTSYQNNITDEFIKPCIIDPAGIIEDGDTFFNFNFRKDRELQIMAALTDPTFAQFETIKFQNLYVTSIMFYSKTIKASYCYKIGVLENTLGEYIAKHGKTQLRIAETEKYQYVTSVFDGLREIEIPGKKEILIPSPNVATFDLAPEMSVYEVTDAVVKEIASSEHDFILLNYANPDMVGHTGNLNAAVLAVEAVDKCLGKVYQTVKEQKGILIITADHGNADLMLCDKNKPVTAHSLSKVPFIICNENYSVKDGILTEIGPTILKIMGLPIPEGYLQTTLLK